MVGEEGEEEDNKIEMSLGELEVQLGEASFGRLTG